MKKEKISFEDYWENVRQLIGIDDTVKMVTYYPDNFADPEEGWEEYDEVIEFRNSCGMLLSKYNIDKGEAVYV